MARTKDFGATNEPDTCLWCGAKLRVYLLDKKPRQSTSAIYSEETQAKDRQREEERQKRVATYGQRRGDYGDGYFCGLRCAYEFAVALAEHGRRLAPDKET